MGLYLGDTTEQQLNTLLQQTFQMNSHADNCAYWLAANDYVETQQIYHEKYAHQFPAWADKLTDLMINLHCRPVREGLMNNVHEYSGHKELFEDTKVTLEKYRSLIYDTIEVAEMNNDREIVNYLDDYLVELSKYILQVNIWANKAAELDGKPAKFDKYFDSFTIV